MAILYEFNPDNSNLRCPLHHEAAPIARTSFLFQDSERLQATIDCKVGGPAQFSGGNVCVFACKCTTFKLTKAHALDDERALACEQGECVQG